MTKDEHYKVDINHMYNLVLAVYMDYKLKDKECPYENLLSQVESYKITNTPFDPKIHNIDNFMVDAYKVYDRYMSIEDKLDEIMEVNPLSKMFDAMGIDMDFMEQQFHEIIRTFEEIIQNCEFEGVHIKGIQKNFLKDLMKRAVEDEDYELAAVLRDKIKSI